ncbi:choline transporter-like protein 2 isoform X2 [Patiria miniata]|uniref:Choline transporter-like protein n=1 Tax=Patiria miniata TaxID=46514 RepID=A0A913Z2Y0_PATMI|nr:choline transporter-like protein 2 isoform X2 [Patiria miniata]
MTKITTSDDHEEEGEVVVKSKYGTPKKYDPTFKGPIGNRSCTDVICCLLFIAFLVGMGVVGYFAYRDGDPLSLVYPTDSRGQICGVSEAVKDKPYLMFFDLLSCVASPYTTLLEFKCPTTQICVSACPNETFAPYTQLFVGALLPAFVEWDKFICDYDFNPQTEYLTGSYQGTDGLAAIFNDQKCASYYLKSTEYASRCLPSFLVDSASDVASAFSSEDTITSSNGESFNSSTAQELFSNAASLILTFTSLVEVLFEDVVASWYLIVGGLGIAMLLSLLFIILMRWLAGIIIWLTLLGLHVLLGLGLYSCWQQYTSLAGMDGADAAITFTTDLSSYLRLQQTWLIIGIILAVLLVILLLTTLCLCNRIRVAISLIKEGSRAVGKMMSTLIWPIFPYILQFGFFAIWATIAVFLATSHQATYTVSMDDNDTVAPADNDTCDHTTFATDYPNTTAVCTFQSYALKDYVLYLQIYNLFGLFWLVNFAIALGQVTLAGAFASYYWAFTKPQDIPAFPLFKSFYRAIRYHLGSIAFGSLIIALIQIIRTMLEYVEAKLKGKENQVVKYVLKCLKCCFWCLEKFMRFLNKNAYILIAVYGENFCTSAKNAFFLLLRNIVRVAVINKLTDFLIFLGELFIVGAVAVTSFFYFTNQITWVSAYITVPTLNYYWVPIFIITIGTYFIAKCFFSVYDMAVDTLFLCFLEDLERHDGSPEKPYYMSKELMGIVGKKNKFDKDD